MTGLQAEPDPHHFDWWRDAQAAGGFKDVPATFDAVVQVLHPYWLGDQPLRWADVAERWGVRADDLPLPRSESPAWRWTGPDSMETIPGEPLDPDDALDVDTAAALLDVLARHTSTPDDVFVARWASMDWSLARERWADAAVVTFHDQPYRLLRGMLDDLVDTDDPALARAVQSGLWWPRDRAWAVHTDLDAVMTDVTGGQDLADELLASDVLEARRAHDT